MFLWANASTLPPEEVRTWYRRILDEMHWQNGVVDTVGAFGPRPGRQAAVGRHQDGRTLQLRRSPAYWFSGRYDAARGASAEQGDNEHIPPFASLVAVHPIGQAPINDTWYFHAGSGPQNSTLSNVRRVVDRRYGPSTDARMFADKAQLAHYEATRAQFEAFAAGDFDTHPMTIYWMLNSHWPSSFANILDYYLRRRRLLRGQEGTAPAVSGVRLVRHR